MAGYTKLFSSILDSTIWREPNHVRLVWITMLAMADKNSVVEASIPGLADRARVSLDECLDALDRLKDEDKFSRSKENEGRRIEELDGGWFLLNHGKYRDLVTLQEKRAQDAERARRYRQRKKQENRDDRDESREITPPSPTPTSTTEKNKTPISPKGPAYTKDFESFWKEYPSRNGRKTGKAQALKEWKVLKPSSELNTEILDSLRKQKSHKNECDRRKVFCAEFQDASRWIKNRRWEDEISSTGPQQTTIEDIVYDIPEI